jgi:uncharacterized membrane protein YhhN
MCYFNRLILNNMKKQAWVIFFIVILIIHLIGLILKIQLVEYVSKPMIVALLGLYFLSQTNKNASGLKKWILTALFFSLAGDVLLMFQQNDKLFFLLGLSVFLVAHIFYIIFFHLIRVKEKLRGNAWLLWIVVVYYAALITLLSPYLGDMKLPVRVYGIVISFMLLLAMHMLFIKNKIAGRWMMTGALLFVISDSILAINKFYQSFEMAGVLIMLTYGLAQLFIVEGAIKYITSTDKE